jgi:hypothetical protein
MRAIRVLMFSLALGTLGLGGCAPTPGLLEKWANRDGSEEMFAEYLQNPDVTPEVRTTALRLLIDQWQYSSQMFLNGRVLRAMPDAAQRDATILAVVPHLTARYEAAETRTQARDAAFQIRGGTDSAEVQTAIDEILMRYVNNDWSPCVESGGSVSSSQVFTVLGPTRVESRIVTVVNDGTFDELLCVARTVGNVPWLIESTAIGTAITARWDAGNLSDVPQFNFELLEFLMRFKTVEPVRAWFFARLSDPNFDPTFKNAVLDWVGRNPAESDIAQYMQLLTNERYTRWSATQAIIERNGSDGLRTVLQSLPATGEYAYYDGEVRPDGFRSVADRVFCTLTKLQEIGDNARRVFEESLATPGVPARALSLSCLKTFGDAQSVAAITTWKTALGELPIPVPGFGEAVTLQSLADETIAAIQARLAAPR